MNVDLIHIAEAYRREAKPEAGYVIVFHGEVAGWVAALANPQSWQPGCAAVAEDGTVYRARGGNPQDGATEWARVENAEVSPRPRLAMYPAQHERARALYQDAFRALAALAEERLNLASDTRAALDQTRGCLERMDGLRIQQPTTEEGMPC